jgi:hypothetical protein
LLSNLIVKLLREVIERLAARVARLAARLLITRIPRKAAARLIRPIVVRSIGVADGGMEGRDVIAFSPADG